MRSKRPDGSIRERAKGCFQIRYTIGKDPVLGKRKSIAVSHKGSYDSAKKELRRLLRTIDTNEHIDPTNITVREYLTHWLETVRSQISPKTHESYTDLVNYYPTSQLLGFMT